MSSVDVERTAGTVRFFDEKKGYGFCKRNDGGPDVFIHASVLKKCGIVNGVKAGDVLEFDVNPVEGKGPKASEIRLIERAPE